MQRTKRYSKSYEEVGDRMGRGVILLGFGTTHENVRFFPVWLHPNNSSLLKEGFVFFYRTFDITTSIELREQFVWKKKCNFAILKRFPDLFSTLVPAGAVQAGVANVMAKKVYVYVFCFPLSISNTENPPSTAATTWIFNQLRPLTYLNKGMEFFHLENKTQQIKN